MIQTDKKRVTTENMPDYGKTVGGAYGTAKKTFSNVIGRKRR